MRGELVDQAVPKPATLADIKDAFNQFENSAKMAKEAGFDGIELHSAHGYLVDSFLRDSSNKRTDEWGGSIENRCKFVLECIDRFLKVYPSDRVGIKLSPVSRYQSMKDEDPVGLYKYLLKELNKRNILYVQLREAETIGVVPVDNGSLQIKNVAKTFRKDVKGFLMSNQFGEYQEAERRLNEGEADLVAVGTDLISNPDLLLRLKNGWPVVKPDPHFYYSSGPIGYSDYPHYRPYKS